MKVQLSLSARQRGELYHYTSADKALSILRSGKFELSSAKGIMVEGSKSGGKGYFASLTRSRFGGYHYKPGGRPSMYGIAQVLITLDGDKLSENYKIIPVDYWGKRGETDPSLESSKEVEERLVSDKHFVEILKYIKRIDFILAGSYHEVQQDIFGRKELKVYNDNADSQSRYIGSVVLQLKKHHIPYGFFPSMDDWAKKRGEFSYFGKKGVDVTGKSPRGTNPRSYRDMKSLMGALSDLPYEELDKKGKDICDMASRYPQDIGAILNDYENARKPASYNQELHDLAVRISRMLTRAGLNTREQIQKFLANKSNTYYNRIQDEKNKNRRTKLAASLVKAIENEYEDWPASDPGIRDENDPHEMFCGKDVYCYTSDDAKYRIKDLFKNGGEEISDLKAVMQQRDILPEDLFYNLFYKVPQSAREV